MKKPIIITIITILYLSIISPIALASTYPFGNINDFYNRFNKQSQPTPTPMPNKTTIQNQLQTIPSPTPIQKSSSTSANIVNTVTPTPTQIAVSNTSLVSTTQPNSSTNQNTSTILTSPQQYSQEVSQQIPTTPIVIPQSNLGLNLIGLDYYQSEQLPHNLTVNLMTISFFLFILGSLFLRGPELYQSINGWRIKNTAQKPAQPFSIPYLEL